MSRNKRRHPKRANSSSAQRRSAGTRASDLDLTRREDQVRWMVETFEDLMMQMAKSLNALYAMKAPAEPLLALTEWATATVALWRELAPDQQEMAIVFHLMDQRPLAEAIESASRL